MNRIELPDPLDLFPPTRDAALARLADFALRAGRDYARARNADPGPGPKSNVSMLSPYIRHRLVTEREAVAAVLERHTPGQAEKFIQEVLWRTYWKGWLQMRPQVWRDFLAERDGDRAMAADNAGLQKALAEAEQGRTGIDCFDDWARELVATGYLHNHARMWFASIWIFTLKLPWALGADLFLRHLLDGDPASNTLSWRWVAGIQTRGKTYLARPGNIAKFTDGRYSADELARQLATEAPPIRDEAPPRRADVQPADAIPIDEPALLLLHGDDLSGFEALPDGYRIAAVRVAPAVQGDTAWPFGDKARAFVAQAAADAADRAGRVLEREAEVVESMDAERLIETARTAGVELVLAPEAPVGPVADALAAIEPALNGAGLKLRRVRRDWDDAAWPHATRGFFPFKNKIPELLTRAGLLPAA